jgi:tetratricopeptide (TPR) repeat protein
VEFANIPRGEYHVEISGQRFTNADSESSISISASGPTEFAIAMRRRNAPEVGGMHLNAFVSAADLAVPDRARKELEKSDELIRTHELQQAIEKLKKAIAIYPQYALAYNNLGVIYSQLGDPARENEALQRAISLNPRFGLAYVNLGRMNMKENDYRAAEDAFNKALSFDANDAVTFILLAYSEFQDKNFDAAIATSGKAHALDKSHAVVHRVAARAFEEKKQGANAISELEMFLKEEPTNPRAEEARHEIDVVRAALPN